MPAPIIAAYNPFLKDHVPVELALAAAELTGADVIVASSLGHPMAVGGPTSTRSTTSPSSRS